MNDPHLNLRDFDLGVVYYSESWRPTHNFEHHTYTNIIVKNRDFGYGTMRLNDDLIWQNHYCLQPRRMLILTLMFAWLWRFP
jgi:hypothetical protein